MTHYIAFTIGPIFSTIQQARKTREMWAASYLFSRLMELLVAEIAKPPLSGFVLLPTPIDTQRNRFGGGIYNDRLFAKLESKPARETVEGMIDNVVAQLVLELTDSETTQNYYTYWRKTLRINWVCKSLDGLEGGKLFTEFGLRLDASELHTPYFNQTPENDGLIRLLTKVYKTKLANNALPEAKGVYKGLLQLSNGLFPSTRDFATFELFQKNTAAYQNLLTLANEKSGATSEANDQQEQKQEQAFFDLVFAPKSPFESIATDYHKYFCIVHADGDNLSRLNSTLNDEEAYKKLSSQLSDFALQAAETINQYGGKPVFIGGDDLLFFAPVCAKLDTNETASVFQLIKALDELYCKVVQNDTTLSFGLTLSYYKFPLFEARNLSYEQLNKRAKLTKWQGRGEKNAIAFRMIRHSGAYFEGVLSKTMLASFVAAEDKLRNSDRDLLSGIVYKMDTLSGLLGQLGGQQTLQTRLEHLFDNYFNEPIHKRNKEQLTLVRDLIYAAYNDTHSLENSDKTVYALLRLLKFVTDRPSKKSQPQTTKTQEQAI